MSYGPAKSMKPAGRRALAQRISRSRGKRAITDEELSMIMWHVPAGVDRLQVEADMNTMLEFRQQLRESRRLTPEERERARKIAQKAKELDELIGDLGGMGRDLKVLLRPRSKALRVELNYITETIELVTSPEWRGRPSSYKVETVDDHGNAKVMSKWRCLSPDDWFIGYGLARIYGRYFGEPAKGGRKDGEPSGKFVNFACAVTAAIGEPVVDETVLSALSKVRHSDWKE
jgi:hypothetical protein